MMRHLLSPKVAKAVAASAVGCALLVLPARAHAQDASTASNALGQGFGDKGQLVISGELTTFFDKVNHAGWTFAVQPAADYFVVPAVSVGGIVEYKTGSDGTIDFNTQVVGLRGGFNFNVNEHLGAWGKVGVAYQHGSTKQGSAASVSSSTTYATVELPIIFHIVPHLFAGVGPYYDLKVAGDGNSGYGYHSLVGGWF
jgi:hypothetical protein